MPPKHVIFPSDGKIMFITELYVIYIFKNILKIFFDLHHNLMAAQFLDVLFSTEGYIIALGLV